MIRRVILSLYFAVCVLCARVPAQDDDQTVRLRVSPAAATRPALKYQLLPGFLDRRPGNAAVTYGKVTAEQHHFFSNRQVWEDWQKLIDSPLEDLRDPDVRAQWQLTTIFNHIQTAARCDDCDWQLPLRDGIFYEMLLGEAQQMRSFARLIDLKTRMEIADGQLDQAVTTLQSGFAMGQHVAAGPTLVNGLVGVAITEMMSRRIHELIQQPDAPNLYWALTQLPQPVIDMRPGVEVEMNAIYLSFDELRNLENDRRSAGYWRETLQDLWAKLSALGGESLTHDSSLDLTLMALKGYPRARAALIEQGMDEQVVDAMPVPRAVGLYTMRIYTAIRDDTFKWFFVPYWQGVEGSRKADDVFLGDGTGEVIPLASMLLPAIGAVRTAGVRADRHVAVLRIVEALRMYAADHEGQLPVGLADIRDVPIPVDPATGQPFWYQLKDGTTAVVEGPALPGAPLRFEIQIAQ